MRSWPNGLAGSAPSGFRCRVRGYPGDGRSLPRTDEGRRSAVRFRLVLAITAASLTTLGAAPVRGVGGVAFTAGRTCPPRPVVTEHLITRPGWISNAVVTEYFPIRETWFDGKLVRAPGVAGRHRVDWLYGPHGVAMNGEGIGADGRLYHFAGPYSIGWVDSGGASTTPCWNGTWTNGRAAWLAFGWRNRLGQVTFPLSGGGWANGPGGALPAAASCLALRPRTITVASLLARGRGRPQGRTARQPCLPSCVLPHACPRLVSRPRHGRGHHRLPFRRLPRATRHPRAALAPRPARLRAPARNATPPLRRRTLLVTAGAAPGRSIERRKPAAIAITLGQRARSDLLLLGVRVGRR